MSSLAAGKPIIPPLRDWLLSEFAEDAEVLRAFLIGRNSGEIRVGHARDRALERRKVLDAFRGFKTPWIHEWIRHEEGHLKAEIDLDDRMDERHNRE